MAIEWEYTAPPIRKAGNLAVHTVIEVVDGTPDPSKEYVAKLEITHPDFNNELKRLLKKDILARRAEDQDESTLEQIDLSDFEAYINS